MIIDPYQFNIVIALGIISKQHSDHLALLSAAKFISADGDSLSEIEFDLSLVAPFEFVILITQKEKV